MDRDSTGLLPSSSVFHFCITTRQFHTPRRQDHQLARESQSKQDAWRQAGGVVGGVGADTQKPSSSGDVKPFWRRGLTYDEQLS